MSFFSPEHGAFYLSLENALHVFMALRKKKSPFNLLNINMPNLFPRTSAYLTCAAFDNAELISHSLLPTALHGLISEASDAGNTTTLLISAA